MSQKSSSRSGVILGLIGPITMTFIFTATSWAGGEGGGGGNAIVCFAPKDQPVVDNIRAHDGEIPDSALNKIISIEALDLNQARQKHGFGETAVTPVLVPVLAGESEEGYINRVIARFDRGVPAISDLVRDSRLTFTQDHIVSESHALKRIADAEELVGFDTGSCVLATVAAQYFSGGTAFLHIDDRLFNHRKHSQLSRNTLIIHEYVYLQGRKLHQKTSRATRDLVGLMITEKPTLTLEQVERTATSLGFIKGQEQDLYRFRLPLYLAYKVFTSGPMGTLGLGGFGKDPSDDAFYPRFYAALKKLGASKKQLELENINTNSLFGSWTFFEELLLSGTIKGQTISASKRDLLMLNALYNQWNALYNEQRQKANDRVDRIFNTQMPQGTLAAELLQNGTASAAVQHEAQIFEETFRYTLNKITAIRINQSFAPFDYSRNLIYGGVSGGYGNIEFPLGQLKAQVPPAQSVDDMVNEYNRQCRAHESDDAQFAMCAYEKGFVYNRGGDEKIVDLDLLADQQLPVAARVAVGAEGESQLIADVQRIFNYTRAKAK